MRNFHVMLALVALLPPQVANSADYYANCDTATASSDCTQNSPCQLQSAFVVALATPGASRIFGQGHCAISTVDITRDITLAGGGSLFISSNGSTSALVVNGVVLTLSGTYFQTNQVAPITIQNGGSLFVDSSFFSTVFNGNSPAGAINATSAAKLSIRRTSFSGNQAASGAVVFSGYELDVQDSFFGGNSAHPSLSTPAYGGALDVEQATIVNISGSTFSQNNARTGGGAVYFGTLATPGPCTISNSTFVNNSSTFQIGAAIMASGASGTNGVVLQNVTLTGSAGATSDISAASVNVVIDNSIIAGTCAASAVGSGGSASIESPGNTCHLTLSQVNVTTSALALGPLQDNGGLTTTVFPGPTSVAIGAGQATMFCQPLDQRGYLRESAHCDAGAVETGATRTDSIFVNGFDG
jgi:predicted outer membrane repeat protein